MHKTVCHMTKMQYFLTKSNYFCHGIYQKKYKEFPQQVLLTIVQYRFNIVSTEPHSIFNDEHNKDNK